MQDRTGAGQLSFKLRLAVGTSRKNAPLFGTPLDITSHPRARVPGCPAALGVAPLSLHTSRNPPCGTWLPHIGSASGTGVEQWVLEDAGGGLVRVRNQVSGWVEMRRWGQRRMKLAGVQVPEGWWDGPAPTVAAWQPVMQQHRALSAAAVAAPFPAPRHGPPAAPATLALQLSAAAGQRSASTPLMTS